MMIIQFNSLGVITSVDTSNASFRQGSKGEVIQAVFAGKSNSTHTAKINFTRPDGTVVQNLIMSPDQSNQSAFLFELDDLWFLAISGNATMTIFLYNASNVIQAQGQATIPIESSDYVDEDDVPITTEQYDSLVALVSNKVNNNSAIIVVDDIGDLDMTQFGANQLFYDKATEQFYVSDGSDYEPAEQRGVLGSKNLLVRFIATQGQITLQSLYNLNEYKQFILGYFSPSNNRVIDYLCQFQLTSGAVSGIRATRLSDLASFYANLTDLPLSSNFSSLIDSNYRDDLISRSSLQTILDDGYVPYTGANKNIDLNNKNLSKVGRIVVDTTGNSNPYIQIFENTHTYGAYLGANAQSKLTMYVGGVWRPLATEKYVDDYVASYAGENLVDIDGNQTITGQKTFSNRIIVSGYFNLYNAQITTNSKSSFARVGVTTNQYVNYELPYNYNDAGNTTFTLATTSMLARSNLVSILQEASQQLNGLMSAEDKRRLDVLYALLGEEGDADDVIDTIKEVLEIFENYPEGFDIAGALALKTNISDIVDNLLSDSAVVPLSAKQGKVLKTHIDNIVNGVTTVDKARKDANGNVIHETYFNHEDGFAVGLVSVEDYNEDTGEITLNYNNTAVTDISYNSSTGEITFTY